MNNVLCTKCNARPADSGKKRCTLCRRSNARGMQAWRDRNPEHAAAYQRQFNRERRERVLKHYGGQCECCSEGLFEFLALDHKDGGGNAHRKEVKQRGANMIGWALANDLPPIFRVLCHNCNSAIGFYGRCPHQPAAA